MSIQDENRTNRGYVETVMEHNLLGLLQGSIAREARPRFLLGVTGPPAAGKSTFAALLAAALNEKMGEGFAVVVPMDGFHLPNEELKERGLGALKGVPQTFDAQGFVDLLERLRADSAETIWCPLYNRELHDRVEGALPVSSSARIILVEGNYLLLNDPPWDQVRGKLDQIWYLDAPKDVIRKRLLKRHLEVGRNEQQAIKKIEETDLPNADLIAATRSLADKIL